MSAFSRGYYDPKHPGYRRPTAERVKMDDLETQVRQALARGYCHPDNAHKELDAKLIEAVSAAGITGALRTDDEAI